MTTLMQASRQWATRPADQRFTSLIELKTRTDFVRDNAVARVVPNRIIEVQPVTGDIVRGLQVVGANGGPVLPNHWSFGQLAALAKAPAGYLRDLPAPIAADCINYGLKVARAVEDVGTLTTLDPVSGAHVLAAATGPQYGRMWNSTVVDALIERFGDGVNGAFRVPGEWGKKVEVTKANTTIYASDRDMFVFLADEEHRIEVPNRRNGKPGGLARGFFVWNSEVGSTSLGIAVFLFDYVCGNRIVWGAENFQQIRVRHSKGVNFRWLEELLPQIDDYANSATAPVIKAIESAKGAKIGDEDTVRAFLAKRFSTSEASRFMAAHEAAEGRPIETVWDAVTGITEAAKALPYQDQRVNLEREAGKILDSAAR